MTYTETLGKFLKKRNGKFIVESNGYGMKAFTAELIVPGWKNEFFHDDDFEELLFRVDEYCENLDL